MLTCDAEKLKKCVAGCRIWQGIPSIALSPKGRIFVAFYSGGTREQIGNYVALIVSDDGGKTFSEPIWVASRADHRCFDCSLWIDPKGRLWMIWAQYPDDAVYGAICDEPDAENVTFGEEFLIGHNIMMNKPTVLSTGEWVFPLAVWNQGVYVVQQSTAGFTPGSYACVTCDEGKTFQLRGGADIPNRSYDEHMFVEQGDHLTVYVRTKYGIGTARSYDGGFSWSDGRPSGIVGPSSRFHIRRLPSGRLLLIYHDDPKERKALTAFLSEDEGKTWPYRLLLDERTSVAYPDMDFDPQGFMNIVYDRDRGAFKKTLDQALSCARQILLARITEQDILAGKLVTPGSFLKQNVSQLGSYVGEDPNPYDEPRRKTVAELAEYLLATYPKEEILERAFDLNGVCCDQQHRVDTGRLDGLCDRFSEGASADRDLLAQILTEMRLADNRVVSDDITESVIAYIAKHFSEPLTLTGIASRFSVSAYYLSHLFKHATGLGVMQFCTERRIARAKILLAEGTQSVTEIAVECGFAGSSRFAEVFRARTGTSPGEYRRSQKGSK